MNKTNKISRVGLNGQSISMTKGGILHSDIWFHHLPESGSINELLKSEILQHRKEQPQRDSMANLGCWRGSAEYTHLAILRRNIIDNVKAIHRHYNEMGPPCAVLDNYPDERFEMNHWANVNEKGSINAIHTHSKWHWSGVYYIQGKGTGKIALYSSPYLNQQVSHGLPFGQSFTLAPSDGMLLMFPSYLMHEVLINPSERQRINIAFNVRVNF